ncbi:MAG: proteasome assembly chaperone family protein [Candidatus Aenigmarchaeota archaeon]|nr:proteasome assembly chaperone family protein [Candidatus Aenigmarchaeota archaeon]
MESWIHVSEKVKLKNPILIEGLPGIGNVGRVATGYLINQLKMKKFAELYSPHFLPLVLVHENSEVHVLNLEFHYMKGKRDIVVLTGDTQSISPEGHYEICSKIVEFAETLGIKEIITLGGFSEGKSMSKPAVLAAVNNKEMIKKYKKFDIDFGKKHQVGTIIGASGLLLGLAKPKKIDGICLLGETSGMPMLTDPNAADAILHILVKILGIKLDFTMLEKSIVEMQERIKKSDGLHKRMLEQLGAKEEPVRYIG